jgi:hypothetical protein
MVAPALGIIGGHGRVDGKATPPEVEGCCMVREHVQVARGVELLGWLIVNK